MRLTLQRQNAATLSSLVLALGALVGCANESRAILPLEARGTQSRLINDTEADPVLRAAEVILRREFGRLQVSAGQRRIVTEPQTYFSNRESGTARDLYGASTRMRRLATFSVAPRDTGAQVRLRIDIEREDTDRREAFRMEDSRLSDAPSYSPIERDAATSARQNTVWTFVKRDFQLERRLLDELGQQFAPLPEGAPPSPNVPAAAGTQPATGASGAATEVGEDTEDGGRTADDGGSTP
jgi:hypothetical protein